MKIAKILTFSFITWLLLFVIDFLYELFQISKSETITTLMGLKIDSQMTKEEINTYFSLTPQMILSFVIIVIIVSILSFLTYKVRKSE
ncbi:hypothetical protein ACWEVE_13145 [Staphylococcus xylosus]